MCYACFWVTLREQIHFVRPIIWGKIGRKHLSFWAIHAVFTIHCTFLTKIIWVLIHVWQSRSERNKSNILFVAIRIIRLQRNSYVLLIYDKICTKAVLQNSMTKHMLRVTMAVSLSFIKPYLQAYHITPTLLIPFDSLMATCPQQTYWQRHLVQPEAFMTEKCTCATLRDTCLRLLWCFTFSSKCWTIIVNHLTMNDNCFKWTIISLEYRFQMRCRSKVNIEEVSITMPLESLDRCMNISVRINPPWDVSFIPLRFMSLKRSHDDLTYLKLALGCQSISWLYYREAVKFYYHYSYHTFHVVSYWIFSNYLNINRTEG